MSNGDPKVFIYQGQFSDTAEYLKSTENNVTHWLGLVRSDNSFYTTIELASMNQSLTGPSVAKTHFYSLYWWHNRRVERRAIASAYFGILNQTVAEGIGPNGVTCHGQMFHILFCLL